LEQEAFRKQNREQKILAVSSQAQVNAKQVLVKQVAAALSVETKNEAKSITIAYSM
jgi:hypothetical protein